MDGPSAIHWSTDDVAKWIKDIGFPQYEQCFRDNFINGRKLINIDGSTLPKLGIQDYAHIKKISADIKENILEIESDHWDRSITLEEREEKALFYEYKSKSGRTSNVMSFEEFQTQRQAEKRKRAFQ